jgi:hypothetical protein
MDVQTSSLRFEDVEDLMKNLNLKTIVEKDEWGETRVDVINFIREGNKYLYGIKCFRDGDEIKHFCWVAQYEKSRVKLLDGARWDLVDAYHSWKTQLTEHREKRRKYELQTWSNLENEARKKLSELMSEWDKNNNEPANPLRDL